MGCVAHTLGRRVPDIRELEGGWVAHEASDGTHLAGKLHATHPSEAHDGGGRGVERAEVVYKTFGGFRCCKSMMEVATL